MKDESGRVMAILHTATDVTARNLYRRELEEATHNRELLIQEQLLNEELAASNEKLSATNEELQAVGKNFPGLTLSWNPRWLPA